MSIHTFITNAKKINIWQIVKDLIALFFQIIFLFCLLVFMNEHGYLPPSFSCINPTPTEYWNVVKALYLCVLPIYLLIEGVNVRFFNQSRYIKRGEAITYKSKLYGIRSKENGLSKPTN